MSLESLLQPEDNPFRKKQGMSEERLATVMPHMRDYISFWREYPDLFFDFMAEGSSFKLYFFQRVFLRIAIRHKYVYAVYPRGYSKSFLSTVILVIRCILFPRAKLFVVADGKEQAAGIIKEKVQELCDLVPAFDKETDRRPTKTMFTKDIARIVFKNGSSFDNVAASEKTRGKRRHGGVIEECISIDGDILSSVIIPLMNISRPCMDGSTQPDEPLNKSQIYINFLLVG